MNIEKRKYLELVWLADVGPADNIHFCSIFTLFRYELKHDFWHNIVSQEQKKFDIDLCSVLTYSAINL